MHLRAKIIFFPKVIYFGRDSYYAKQNRIKYNPRPDLFASNIIENIFYRPVFAFWRVKKTPQKDVYF
jgi:hypothetical protein